MSIPLLVHVTHEAALKIGGIGAVLEGLLSTSAYNSSVGRTILAGPWPSWDHSQMQRILSPRSRLQVRWASRYDIWGQVNPELGKRLSQVETEMGVEILYAHARYGLRQHEVLLVDFMNVERWQVDRFSHSLWTDYGIEVSRYSHSLEFQGFVDLAVPLAKAVLAIAAEQAVHGQCKSVIAHDWMGLPTVFALRQLQPADWKLFFYAHEVAPVRRLVEDHEGHDTRFYNAMYLGLAEGQFADNLFGSQHDLYKTPLIHSAASCDGILAVSDLVEKELRFLGARFQSQDIDLAYNGIPSRATSIREKKSAKALLQRYCACLFGYEPDFVFSHITRMVQSKALWRDAKVLGNLAPILSQTGRTAVLFVLSTSTPTGRAAGQVLAWEQEYGWPVGHRGDNGDLMGLEVPFFFDVVESFNQEHANLKIVLVNQFGWERALCGKRMPPEMDFEALRIGTDGEFGQSIYEPFGIAQLESLTHGAICITSSACGCSGLVAKVGQKGGPVSPYIEADYISLPESGWIRTAGDALHIRYEQRNFLEEKVGRAVAVQIQEMLAQDDLTRARYLEEGMAASQEMSWERMAAQYFVPAVEQKQSNRS